MLGCLVDGVVEFYGGYWDGAVGTDALVLGP